MIWGRGPRGTECHSVLRNPQPGRGPRLKITQLHLGHLQGDACRAWMDNLRLSGVLVVVPEIADYEVRRELIRAGIGVRLTRLDALSSSLTYDPITNCHLLPTVAKRCPRNRYDCFNAFHLMRRIGCKGQASQSKVDPPLGSTRNFLNRELRLGTLSEPNSRIVPTGKRIRRTPRSHGTPNHHSQSELRIHA